MSASCFLRGAVEAGGEVADPEGDRTHRDVQLGRDVLVPQALLSQFAGLGAEVVLSVGAAGPRWGRHSTEPLREDAGVDQAECLPDLAAGLARPAEGYRLGAQLFKITMCSGHIRTLERRCDILSGGTLNIAVNSPELWLVEVKQLL